tara:strand:- start:13576 stop:13815 length:240 start_codon:yes stop_codon:yes gene_type:complete
MQLKRGDLIHIPANTYFFKIRLEDDCVKKFIVSKEPKVYLLADSKQDKYYKVMVDNDFWFVRKADVYYNIERGVKYDRA